MSRLTPEPSIAAWPALLTTDLACLYTQLSEQSFRWLAHRSGVRPVDCAGLAVTRWRRGDLDRMIDSLAEKGAPAAEDAPQTPTATTPAAALDPATDALARAARRASRG